MCELVNKLRPDVRISVAGIFGKGINDRAWCYSTLYDDEPPNFEKMMAKDEKVSSVEVFEDAVYIYFDMNKKEKLR